MVGWGVKKRVPPDKEELIEVEEASVSSGEDMDMSDEDEEQELLFGGNGEWMERRPRR